MSDLGQHLAPAWKRVTEIEVDRGEGAYLYATDGRRYLDFTSGIGVTNTGHCHPRVVRAVQEQAARLLHGQANIVYTRPLLELVRELKGILPPDLHAFFFSNSGAEAIEGAVKLARQVTGRHALIVFRGGFHGRTYGAMAWTTSNVTFRTGYAPFPASVYVAPFPYPYRWSLKTGAPPERCLQATLADLEEMLATQVPAQEVAAILVEPVLGEGGYVVPPPGFLQRLRELCDRIGSLLVVDEIQTGFGRTGRLFAFEHEGVTPDVVVVAKGLGSGLPISAIAARPDLVARWLPGSHGGTYGGNPVACAAAAETIRVLREEGLVENARKMGALLLEALREVAAGSSRVGDVRSLGLMAALEMVKDGGEPDGDAAWVLQREALAEGLLLLTCGPYNNVVRFVPPLIIGREEVSEVARIVRKGLASLGG